MGDRIISMAKIVFLQHLWYEYLGPMYISAVLKKNGHQCEVFIEEGQRKDFRIKFCMGKPI